MYTKRSSTYEEEKGMELIKKEKGNIFTIILSICDVIAVIVLFLLYGPYNNFRDWLVTTAMSHNEASIYC